MKVRRISVTVRAIAIPSEHGGWGLTAESVLLGLLVAPSVAGWAAGAICSADASAARQRVKCSRSPG